MILPPDWICWRLELLWELLLQTHDFELKEKQFYPKLVKYIISSPVICMVCVFSLLHFQLWCWKMVWNLYVFQYGFICHIMILSWLLSSVGCLLLQNVSRMDAFRQHLNPLPRSAQSITWVVGMGSTWSGCICTKAHSSDKPPPSGTWYNPWGFQDWSWKVSFTSAKLWLCQLSLCRCLFKSAVISKVSGLTDLILVVHYLILLFGL